MKVSISTPGADKVIELDVEVSMSLGDLKALIEVEFGFPQPSIRCSLNGSELEGDAKSLSSLNVKPYDLIIVRRVMQQQPQQRPPALPQPQQQHQPPLAAGRRNPLDSLPEDPEQFRQQLLRDPRALNELAHSIPQIIEAVSHPVAFADLFRQLKRYVEAQEQQRRLTQTFEADPFNVDVQRQIEAEIQQSRINENLQQAMEYTPETFASVFMLYVNATVNNVPVKVFVDSGAQMTIVSEAFAERCGLHSLIDRRYQGMAMGVGTQRIIGRIHMALLKLGGEVLPCSFSVLESQPMDVLLGLDMLKRHQGVIDLQKNVLRFGTTETPFLGEADIPKSDRTMPKKEAGEGESSSTPPAPSASAPPSVPAAVVPAPALPAQPPRVPPPHEQQPEPARPPTVTPNFLQAIAGLRMPGQPVAASAPAPAPAAVVAPAPVAAVPDTFPDEVVQGLMALGVSREQAIHALKIAGGNPDVAAGILFS